LSRQYLAINGGDLMRQCFDLRCSDAEIRVEEVGEPYSVCLRREPEQATVGIERIAPTRLDKLEAGFLATIEEASPTRPFARNTMFSASAPKRATCTISAMPAGSSPFNRAPGFI
jgi:hypothetical protein